MKIDLSGHIAVVTGAGAGIGATIAHSLATAGATVAAADLDEDSARATAEEIGAVGGIARGFYVDVSDAGAVGALREQVEDAFGPASIVVNNAGWGEPRLFVETGEPLWERIVAINLMGPVRMCRTFMEPMIDRGSGRIVNISSDAGRVGSTGETVYAGAKGGVIAFTKSLARELARHGVNVNCVCPGPTDTALFRKHSEKMQEALTRAIPFRRLGRPGEIASAVTFLASDEAAFITGQVLSVSGGLTMAG